MNLALETDALSKDYGALRAVADLSLRVARGEIYGFVGLNGAGKTTTIRLLLGMLRPTSGTARLLGKPIARGGSGPWDRVGYLAGSPSAYPRLTVRENLELARRLRDLRDDAAVDRAIDLFALSRYARLRAGTLSTGNLQRLGLARAFLHDPELLILDEPANGLDPAGVVEIRELLRARARDHGVTIFMSSHILTEVDRLATRIGIIHRGRLIEELDARALEELRAPRLHVVAPENEVARTTLEAAGYSVTAQDGALLLSDRRALDAPQEVASLLAGAGAPPSRLAVEQEDLESHFLRLIGKAQ